MLDKILLPLLSPLLDRLGAGWKSALGLLVMAGLLIAHLLGKLTTEQYDTWFTAATLFFGIGIYHSAKGEPPATKDNLP